MKFEKLGNIAEIIAGQSPPSSSYNKNGDGFPFFQGKTDYGKINPVTRTWCNQPTKISLPGDILISVRAPVGPVNINNVKACIGRGLSAIRVKNNISRDYVFYFLKTNEKKISKLGVGSTFTAITQKDLHKIIIPIQPYTDQLHIANILSQAENLIAQRKESIRLLDEFLKSTFLEMFGDPVRNEKGYNKGRFGDFVKTIIAGSSYGGEQKENLNDNEFGVLKISAVTWGVFNPKEFKVVNKVDLRGKVIHPAKGDLLFSRANTKELVGATCIVDADYPKLFLPDKIWNIKLKETELNKVYVHYLFKNSTFKNILTQDATGTSGSMLNISMEKLRNVKFPKPPIELQTQFAQIVEKTEELKTQYQQSLQELENLYGSLSQRAFKGELRVKDGEVMMAAEAVVKYQNK